MLYFWWVERQTMNFFNLRHSWKSKGAYNPYATQFAPYKKIWILEYGKLLVLESGIPSFGIQNPANDWNPESKFHWQSGIQHLESEIHCLESRIQDCLGFPSMGRHNYIFTWNVQGHILNKYTWCSLKENVNFIIAWNRYDVMSFWHGILLTKRTS